MAAPKPPRLGQLQASFPEVLAAIRDVDKRLILEACNGGGSWAEVSMMLGCAPHVKESRDLKAFVTRISGEESLHYLRDNFLKGFFECDLATYDETNPSASESKRSCLMMLADRVDPSFFEMFGVRWLMTSESCSTLLTRHVVPPVVVRILDRPSFFISCETAIGLIAGESGAGKTFAVLNLLEAGEIGVYLRAPELTGKPAWEDWMRQHAGDKDRRNAALESVVCHMVNFVMGAAVLESLNSPTSAASWLRWTRWGTATSLCVRCAPRAASWCRRCRGH
jgi:hypothetical protein